MYVAPRLTYPSHRVGRSSRALTKLSSDRVSSPRPKKWAPMLCHNELSSGCSESAARKSAAASACRPCRDRRVAWFEWERAVGAEGAVVEEEEEEEEEVVVVVARRKTERRRRGEVGAGRRMPARSYAEALSQRSFGTLILSRV
jgi:hypothetical protein